MIKRGIVEAITVLFIILWIYTGLNKIIDGATFKSQLERSPFIQPMAAFIATILPIGELLLSALLVFKRTRGLGLYLSFGLILLFTGYVGLMLNFTYDLPCNCGGVISSLSWNNHLWFNAAFALLAIIAILLQNNTLSPVKRKEVLT